MVLLVNQNSAHDFVPDRGSTGDAGGDITHRGIVVIADPGSSQDIGSIADGPVIPKIIGGAGFDADRAAGDDELAVGTEGVLAGVVVFQDVANNVGNFFRQGNPNFPGGDFGRKRVVAAPKGGPVFVKRADVLADFIRLVLFQNLAIKSFDLEDGVQWNGDAGVGESAKGDGHVGHGDFAAAKSERQAVTGRIGESRNTHGASGGDKGFQPVEGEHFDRRDV